jgi:hypothetical protein
MIWHIFRKDWTLLRRLAIGIAIAQLVFSGILWKFGESIQNGRPSLWFSLVSFFILLARGFLIVEAGQKDPLPGVRQDWLVRPIRRIELLAAKLLFTILAIQGPVFVGDLLESLAYGFPLGASLQSAFGRSVLLFAAFCLPVLALSAVTTNLLQVLLSGVVGFVILSLTKGADLDPRVQRLVDTGVGWMVIVGFLVILAILAAIILMIQFQKRRTVISRVAALAGGLLTVASISLPWLPSAFALQSRFSPVPGAASQARIEFDPSTVSYIGARSLGSGRGGIRLRLPLAISIPLNTVLVTDHVSISLIDSSGTVRAKSESERYTTWDKPQVARQDDGTLISTNNWPRAWHSLDNAVQVNTVDYLQLKDQKIHLTIDYSFTLFGLTEAHGIPALNGNERLSGIGSCHSGVDPFLANSIMVDCVNAGRIPTCLSWFLEHTPSGRRSDEIYQCNVQDYSPFYAEFLPDSLSRLRIANGLQFRNPIAHQLFYVVEDDIPKSQVVIRSYQPLEHFTRRIVTPEKPLNEWLMN